MKIEGMDLKTTMSDIRKLFKENGARPEEIFLVLGKGGNHVGEAFLEFSLENVAERGKQEVDGKFFLSKYVSVSLKTEAEFAEQFPGRAKERAAARKDGGGKVARGGAVSGKFSKGGRHPPEREGGQSGFFGDTGGEAAAVAAPPPKRVGRDPRDSKPPPPSPRQRAPRGPAPPRRGPPPPRRAGRSRSPIRSRDRRDHRDHMPPPPMFENVDERKFVRLSNGTDNPPTEPDVTRFFDPLVPRDIIYCRSARTGKVRAVLLEFFTVEEAKQACLRNRRRLPSGATAVLVPPTKEEVMENLARLEQAPAPGVLPGLMGNIPGLDIAAQNPQVAQLLNVLSATVTNIAQAAVMGGAPMMPPPPPHRRPRERGSRGGRRGRGRRPSPPREARHRPARDTSPPLDMELVKRVAQSANLDIKDIQDKRVVGIRHLPEDVTAATLVNFFEGCRIITDSIRIHYLNNGRCSGDAIVSFGARGDARAAIHKLNNQMIGKNKVELFFLCMKEGEK